MPPTVAAAMNTACGRFCANQSATAAWSRRSICWRGTVSISQSSRASRRTNAEPTMPRCPATYTRLPRSSYGVISLASIDFAKPGRLGFEQRNVAGDHFAHNVSEIVLGTPAEPLSRLCRIADQSVDFGRAIVPRVDRDDRLPRFYIDADFIRATTLPVDAAIDLSEGCLDKFAHAVRRTRREHVIVGLILLQDQPHALDKVARVTPVALGVEIAEIERVLSPAGDRRDSARNLAGDKGFAAGRPLMVEQDAV